MQSARTVQTVVVLLGVIAIGSVAGLVFLASNDDLTDPLTTGLFGLATGCVGAIAGILARTDSVDVDGLDKLREDQEAGFLPQLQASIDQAKAEGTADGHAAALRQVAGLIGPADPVTRHGQMIGGPPRDPLYDLGGAQDLSDEGDEVDGPEVDEPPDPFEDTHPGMPPIPDDDPLATPAR